jgi:hypothetical protein
MEDRSISSYHGRRREKPWRMEMERRERKVRKAGVAIGGWDRVWGFEIGIVGEDILAARET